jgi:hypothetical protein
MLGIHQYDKFNLDSNNLYSDNGGAYLGYNCYKYGKGNHTSITKKGNIFKITVDFSKDLFIFEHYNQTTTSSISNFFGNSEICFSFLLYYSQTIEIEFE